MLTLTDCDAVAVDMLLESANPGDAPRRPGNGGSATAAPIDLAQRMKAVASLLETLSLMPACEPPSDLVERTLLTIARRGAAGLSAPPRQQPIPPVPPA
jgi:hypothetical protein